MVYIEIKTLTSQARSRRTHRKTSDINIPKWWGSESKIKSRAGLCELSSFFCTTSLVQSLWK